MSTQTEWDEYFMTVARVVGENSKCRSRRIGAVLVRGKSIVSTGYNGPPVGMRPCDRRWVEDGLYGNSCEDEVLWGKCPRQAMGYKSGEGLHLCVAGHAERNALIQAAKLGIATEGTTLYCHCGQVCKDCAIEIVNAGVKTLVYLDGMPAYDALSDTILKECGMEVRKVSE
jgi:dCMP deaminase